MLYIFDFASTIFLIPKGDQIFVTVAHLIGDMRF